MKTLSLIALLFTCFVVNAQTTKKPTKSKVVKYYTNGKPKAEGIVVNNKKEGEWIYYHENGKVALKKSFVNGVANGEWLYYNEDGNLVLKVDDISKVDENANLYLYKDGKVVGTKKVMKDNIIVKQKF